MTSPAPHAAPPTAAGPNEPPSPQAGPSWRRKLQVALTLAFLAVLVLPNLDLAFGLDPNPSPIRNPMPFPKLRLDGSLVHFPGDLLAYLKTSMGFRGALVRAHGLIAWHGLGVSPAPESVIRADPWLFLRSEDVPDDYRRVRPFSPPALEAWRTTLEARRAWLAARGIHFLVVVAPNKETIYAEQVPPWLTRAPVPSRAAQLRDAIIGKTGVDFLDLTPALTRHRDDGRLYHLTDTHWNDRGALVGYREIVERLRPWYPTLPTPERETFHLEAHDEPGGDLARMVGLKVDLPEHEEQFVLDAPAGAATFAEDGRPVSFERMDVQGRPRFVTRAPGGEIPSAVILRDSFGEALVPLLARHIREATWIWTYDFPADDIEAAHPDLVIEELVERKLMILTPTNPAHVGDPAAAAAASEAAR